MATLTIIAQISILCGIAALFCIKYVHPDYKTIPRVLSFLSFGIFAMAIASPYLANMLANG